MQKSNLVEFKEFIIEETVSWGTPMIRIYFNDTSDILGVDKIYLKIVLPDLPFGLTYKKSIFDDLFDRLELDIHNQIIFRYDRDHLKFLNRFLHTNETFQMQQINNSSGVLYYPINLDLMFGDSLIENNTNHLLNSNYRGIRLCDLCGSDLQLAFCFSKINDLIEIQTGTKISDDIDKILSKLKIECVSVIGRVLYSDKIQSGSIECTNECLMEKDRLALTEGSVTQSVTTWIAEEYSFTDFKNSIVIFDKHNFSGVSEILFQIEFNKEFFIKSAHFSIRDHLGMYVGFELENSSLFYFDDKNIIPQKNLFGMKFPLNKFHPDAHFMFRAYPDLSCREGNELCKITCYFKTEHILTYDKNERINFEARS